MISVQVDTAKLGRILSPAHTDDLVTAYLLSSFLDEVHSRIELTQLVVTTARVGEDLDAIEPHEDMWACWCEELLTKLNPNTSIMRADHAIAEWNLDLICDSLNDSR